MPYYNLGGNSGSGGGAVINDNDVSENTVFSSLKTMQLISKMEYDLGIKTGIEFPSNPSPGQRFYSIIEDIEYVYRGYALPGNLVDKTPTLAGGETEVITPNGVVVTTSSTEQGYSVNNLFDGNIETSWKPAESDAEPYIDINLSVNGYPKVIALKIYGNLDLIAEKDLEIYGYNIQDMDFNIIKVKDPNIPANTYTLLHLKEGINSYSNYKIVFKNNAITINDLELHAGLWVPVY